MARAKGMGNLQLEKGGRWTVRVCIDGARLSRSTRTRNRSAAEAYLQRFLAPFGLGERALPLASAWSEYEKSPDRRELSPATMKAKRLVWMHFAGWIETNHVEVSNLRQLSHDIVAEYLRVLRLDHSASTYNNRVCVLREVCRVLAPKAGMTEDPWDGVRLLADDVHTRREFSMEELGRIMSAATRAGGEWRLLFAVGIYTGLRLGDCCTLEWSAVDLDRGIIQLIPRKTRRHANGRPVTIPIHPDLADLIRLCPRQDGADYLMPQTAELYLGAEHWRIGSGLCRIFKDAGIRTSVRIEGRKAATPDATFHSLRHTFVSFSVNAGVPLTVVQSIVGHSSSAMTRHYYHENEEALRRAVAVIPSIGDLPRISRIAQTAKQSSDESRKGEGRSNKGKSRQSTAVRLRMLTRLRMSGLIMEEEYARERERILAEI